MADPESPDTLKRRRYTEIRMRQKRRAGITLVELLAAGMAVLVAACVFVPVLTAGGRRARIEDCSSRLKTLYQAAASLPGEAPAGRAYWTRLAPEKVAPGTLRCPLADLHPLPDSDYLGPAKPEGKLEGDLPLGCDVPSNHSPDGNQGGNVILRSGQVVTDHTLLWRAATHGDCKP